MFKNKIYFEISNAKLECDLHENLSDMRLTTSISDLIKQTESLSPSTKNPKGVAFSDEKQYSKLGDTCSYSLASELGTLCEYRFNCQYKKGGSVFCER